MNEEHRTALRVANLIRDQVVAQEARRLAASGWVRPDERVVVFNTGTGLKYLDTLPAL